MSSMIDKAVKFTPALLICCLALGGFFYWTNGSRAISTDDVVINEIAWMGTTANANGEWIELFNNTGSAIDLTDWSLRATDGTPSTTLSGIIPADGFFLLERTNDDSAPDATADQIYTGALGNTGETLTLYDNTGNAINIVSGWSAGDNVTKQTMARIDPTEDNWGNSANPGGTPGATNDVIVETNNPPTAAIDAPAEALVDEIISFDASASTDSDGTVESYDWDFGDGATSTGNIVEHNYSTINNFTINLTITDDGGATSTASVEINIIADTAPATTTPTSTVATTGPIKINEVVMDPITGQDEWLELYNPSTSTIDLTDWKIVEGAGSTTTLSGIIETEDFLLIDSVTGGLNNDGDIITLYDSTGTLIDSVTYGSWDDANLTDNAPVVSDPYSVARSLDGVDSDTDNVDWVKTASTTPGAANIITALPTTPTPSGGGGSTSPTTKTTSGTTGQSSDIVINELMPNPADGDEEWIELYNNKTTSLDLTGWKIVDGAGGSTTLTGTIASHDFIVVTKPKGALNNDGDLVKLLDSAGSIIDQVAYGSWNDGKTSDNAVLPAKDQTIARVKDGQDTGKDNIDFAVTTTPTQDKTNKITAVAEEAATTVSDFIINEVLPNPIGEDTNEFIELKNISATTISVKGLTISDAATSYTITADTKIITGGFYLIKRADSKIALNNTGAETVSLKSGDKIISQVEYSGAKEAQSYSRDDSDQWRWTETITPNATNEFSSGAIGGGTILIGINNHYGDIGQLVELEIIDATAGQYDWSFGDGATATGSTVSHRYSQAGAYRISVTSGGVELGSTFVIIGGARSSLVINELLPNPVGTDSDNEFIELYNPLPFAIDLTGWLISDEQSEYELSGTIDSLGYLVIRDSGITLNNDTDEIVLTAANNQKIDQVEYEGAKEGSSYSRFETQWNWSGQPTPGEVNIFSAAISGAGGRAAKGFQAVTIDQARQLPNNTRVSLTGRVAVVPGIIGSQIFYLAGSGIQVYSNKKDFPDLKEGMIVRVNGVLSEVAGEKRIKTAQAADITIIDSATSKIEPHPVAIGEIDEEYEGWLVSVTGTILEIKGSNLIVADGDSEISVNIKPATGINLKEIYEGDLISITGIVSQTASGYRLLPRQIDDLKVSSSTVLGVQEQAPPADRQKWYWWLIGLGAIGILAANYWRKKFAPVVVNK